MGSFFFPVKLKVEAESYEEALAVFKNSNISWSQENKIDELSRLYEEGKDCLFELSVLDTDNITYDRLFGVLKEMRDLAAAAIKNQKS